MKYAAVIVLCLLSTTSWSMTNPQINSCQHAGGEFVAVELADGSDQVGLCKFGNAYVGALDVLYYKNKESNPTSFQEYKNGNTSCSGDVIDAQILQGDSLQLCRYGDSSVIEMNTLQSGSGSNPGLDRFLGL